VILLGTGISPLRTSRQLQGGRTPGPTMGHQAPFRHRAMRECGFTESKRIESLRLPGVQGVAPAQLAHPSSPFVLKRGGYYYLFQQMNVFCSSVAGRFQRSYRWHPCRLCCGHPARKSGSETLPGQPPRWRRYSPCGVQATAGAFMWPNSSGRKRRQKKFRPGDIPSWRTDLGLTILDCGMGTHDSALALPHQSQICNPKWKIESRT